MEWFWKITLYGISCQTTKAHNVNDNSERKKIHGITHTHVCNSLKQLIATKQKQNIKVIFFI